MPGVYLALLHTARGVGREAVALYWPSLGRRGQRLSMSQECRLVSMHGLLRLLRLLIRAQLIR